MKYLKEFEATADYAAYSADTDNFILPNISVCNDNIYKVYYNTFEKPTLRVKYNVENDSEPTLLYYYSNGSGMSPIENYGVDVFTKAVIDETEEVSIESLDAEQGTHQLSSGEHTVEYSLKDETALEGPIFLGCDKVADVVIPNGVTSIKKKCFTIFGRTMCYGPFIGCSAESVTMPDSLTSIDEMSFLDSGLSNLQIGKNVININDGAFASCGNLSSITVDNANTVYDSRNNCNAIIETSTNTLILGCKNTIIPNDVTSIGGSYYSFDRWVGAFASAQFTSINIPNSVTAIGNGAFNMCSNLTSVTVNATTPPTLGEGAFDNNAEGRTIYVPSASVDTYKATEGWSVYADSIQAI